MDLLFDHARRAPAGTQHRFRGFFFRWFQGNISVGVAEHVRFDLARFLNLVRGFFIQGQKALDNHGPIVNVRPSESVEWKMLPRANTATHMRQVTRIRYNNSVSTLIALMIHGLARFGHQRSSFTCFQALQKLGAHTHAHARTHTLTHMHTERPSAT